MEAVVAKLDHTMNVQKWCKVVQGYIKKYREVYVIIADKEGLDMIMRSKPNVMEL